MRWRNKSEMVEKYCAVHNVDCPYHGKSDVEVLGVKNSKSSPWICPEGVLELAEEKEEAERLV